MAATSAEAVTLTAATSPANPVSLGDIVSVTLSIDSGAQLFDGFEMNVDFDPAVLSYRADLVDFDVFTPVWFLSSAGIPDMPAGTIAGITAGVFTAGNAGAYDLVELAFQVVGLGTSDVTFRDFANKFVLLGGVSVFNNVSLTTTIEVQADVGVIPLPAGGLLLPLAVAGLALLRRRRA